MRRMEQYFPVPGHQVPSFARKYVRLFYLCLLALGLLDDAEVEINDVLGEGDNTTFIVRVLKQSGTT